MTMENKDIGLKRYYELKLNFEKIISKISTRFVGDANQFEWKIQESLKDIGIASGASRAYLFRCDEDKKTMSNTFEWCNEGVSAEINNLQNIPIDIFPWWMDQLRNNQIINIFDISQMPSEASGEQKILEAQDIKALIVLPIKVNGKLNGYVGFDNVIENKIWEENNMLMLRLISDIFGNFFSRIEYENELLMKYNDLEQAHKQLKALQIQLIQQEKMISVGQLAAGLAHEINNPLGFVSSNFEMLSSYIMNIQEVTKIIEEIIKFDGEVKNNDELSEVVKQINRMWKELRITKKMGEVEELTDDIKDGFERIAKIVNSVRNFACENITNYNLSDINEIIEETLIVLNSEIKDTADIAFDAGMIPPVLANRNEIGQVIMNIIINSVQAIRYGVESTRGNIELKTYQKDDFVFCEINDDAGGIPIEIQNRIFEPFFTTRPVGKGTGLGLSIAYDIVVNKHHGELYLKNTEDTGSSFVIKLMMH